MRQHFRARVEAINHFKHTASKSLPSVRCVGLWEFVHARTHATPLFKRKNTHASHLIADNAERTSERSSGPSMVRAVWVVRFPALRGAGNATFSHMYHTTYIGCVRVYLCPGPKVKTTIDNVDLTNMSCHVQCARVFSNPPPPLRWNCTYCTVFIPIYVHYTVQYIEYA